MEIRTSQVGAHAAALSTLHPLAYNPDTPTSFAAGVGTYRDEVSYAIGVFHYTSDRFMFNLAASVTEGADVMGRAGLSFSLGKGSSKKAKNAKLEKEQMQEMLVVQQHVAKLERENSEIKNENSSIKQANEEIRQENSEIKKGNEAIRRENAENKKLILELLKRTAKPNSKTVKSSKTVKAKTKKKTKK